MIRTMLVGAAVLGGGGYYVSSAYMRADVVRTVRATPHDTWRGFNLIFNDYAQAMMELGTMNAEPGNGFEQPFRTQVTSRDSEEIDFRLLRKEVQVARVRIGFAPLSGGAETRLSIDTESDAAALPDGRPVYGGDIMLRRALGSMVDKIVPEIESGKLVRVAELFADMRRRIATDPRMGEVRLKVEQRRREEAQAAASRPMLDPDKVKLNPRGTPIIPSDPRPR